MAGGVLLLVVGAVATFVPTAPGSSPAMLIPGGVLLLVIGLFANLLASLEFGGMKAGFKADAAAATLDAADRAEEVGRDDAAVALREQARRFLSEVEPISAQYEEIRRTKEKSWARTLEMEQKLTSQARRCAAYYATPESIEELYFTGREGHRVSAIFIMELKPDLASQRAVIDALHDPITPFEQFHAMKVIEHMIEFKGFTASDLIELRREVQRVVDESDWPETGSDRRKLAQRILARS